jgi:hypothetical protein
LFLMGVTSGYSAVHINSWYQQRAEPSMMGRVMSLRMFGIFGLMPVSLTISGFVADVSLEWLFIAAGSLLLLITLASSTQRAFRIID